MPDNSWFTTMVENAEQIVGILTIVFFLGAGYILSIFQDTKPKKIIGVAVCTTVLCMPMVLDYLGHI